MGPGAMTVPEEGGELRAELLRVAPFLAELPLEEVTNLADALSVEPFEEGEVVVEEGMPGDRLYFVTRGSLVVTTAGADGRPVPVGRLWPGDFFGEVALLTGRPRAATVTAECETICLGLGKESWARLVDRHPRVRILLEEAAQSRAGVSAEAVVEEFRRRPKPGVSG